jgi:starch phosphorylase
MDISDRVDSVYLNPDDWNRMAILNTARMGYFSSDRTIQEYAKKIWHIEPVPRI